MSTDDHDLDAVREQAAKTLLGGRGRIKAKAYGLTPVQAARRWYGDDTLDTIGATLEQDHVELTDDLLAAIRDGDDGEIDLDQVLADARAAAGRGDDQDQDQDGSGDSGSDGVSANIMSATEFADQRRRQRERVESNSLPTPSDDPNDPDDVALAAMDGDDRIEATQRGQSPAEYIQAEYGLRAGAYDDGGALHAAILEQDSDGSDDSGGSPP